jgi:hypothetical protein
VTVTRLARALALAAALAAGCGAIASRRAAAGDSPERAVARMQQAVRSRDWGALYDAVASPRTRARFDADFEKVKRDLREKGGDAMFARAVLHVRREDYLRMSARDFFVRTSEAAGGPASLFAMLPDAERLRDAKVAATRIDGDEAVVTLDLGASRRPMRMLRESGAWYVQVLDDD